MDALRILPVSAVVRRSTGTIVDVSDHLLKDCGLRREDVVGKVSREIWPQPDSWAEADRHAMEVGSLTTLELSASGRWWRSTRTRLDDDLLLWAGEDITSTVQLSAARSLLHAIIPSDTASAIAPHDAALVPALLHGTTELASLARSIGKMPPDILASLVRIAR